jgi:cytochrome c-type biogenesis protein
MESQNITIGIAFAAGILSFLSPCVLPLVPGYISLMSGVSIDRLKEGSSGSGGNARRAVILNSLAFNAGLSVIFLALGTTAGLVGASIISNPWVRGIGGVIIILFGLQLIGLLKISTLYKDTRFFSNEKPRGPLGSFTLGIAFAAGWTPCIGPILGGILGLAAASGGWRSGLMLSAFYSAGLSIPFLVTGLGINQFLAFYGKFRKHLHKVEVVSGAVLIVVGLLVMTGKSTLLTSSRLAAWLPNAEGWIKVNPSAPATSSVPSGSLSGANFELAPEVHFQTLAGQEFTLGQLRGNVVLLNFWATWCIPCREEIPVLNAMQHELEPRGLRIVGASLEDTAEGVESYQKEVRKFEYQVLVGGDEAKAKFGGTPLPTTYLIDREGRIRQKIIGARDRAGWEAAVKPLLDEAPATAFKTN